MLHLLATLLLLLPVASAASPCTSDIEAAGIRVGDAAANIAEAVSACKNNASACALDISSAVTNLGMASESITKAVSDCGGTNNTECAKDITEIATALGKAATSVSTAATDCKKLDFKCILDVGGAAAQLAVIVSGISAAVGDCKSGAAVDDLFARLVGFVVNGLQRGDRGQREREEATRMNTGTPTNWSDCGLSNATMHIDLISSTNPVHKGEQQIINKTVHFDHTYTNVTIDYAQYWRVLGHWVKFLDIKRNGCEEHPVMCGAAPGTKVQVSTLHPPLNPLTPFGMYRSTQHYYDAGTGALIGCADMMIPYEK